MTDRECVELLQWAAPRLRLRWEGFRRVRGQVCKRVGRRMKELGLQSAADYRARLEADPTEWEVLDSLCRVTISRFFRDGRVFDTLRESLLPPLLSQARARGETVFRVWSAGCASGEEPYSVSILYRLDLEPRFPELRLELIATEANAALLERADAGSYPTGSLEEVPWEGIFKAFSIIPSGGMVLLPRFREGLTFLQQDLRAQMPDGPFHLVLCRNVAFTYFAPPLQQQVLSRLLERLAPEGLLVIGGHESLPEGATGLERAAGALPIFRKLPAPGSP